VSTAALSTLLAQGHVVAPGAYDALTALLVEQAGFPAIYLGGSAVSYTQLGRPDVGLVGYEDVAERLRVIRNRVDLPVIVDLDTGYGGAVAVQRAVAGVERAGASAVQIEDQAWPKRCGHLDGRRLEPTHVMVAKVQAAVDARQSSDLLIIARTDALEVEGLEAAMERAEAYRAVGCDLVYVEGPRSEEEMRTITSRIGGWHAIDMVEGGRIPLLSADRLASIGYRLVIYPNPITRAVVFAARAILSTLITEGTTASVLDRVASFDELQDLLGLPELLAVEDRFEGGA
jgi:2-methylisocitrate lyase-like PEP mutase family enzyme